MEHGCFTPIVTSSFGGLGKETSAFVSRLVEKLAEKNGMETSIVSNYVRSKLSFELIRAQVACICGSRSLWRKPTIETEEMEVVDSKARMRNE